MSNEQITSFLRITACVSVFNQDPRELILTAYVVNISSIVHVIQNEPRANKTARIFPSFLYFTNDHTIAVEDIYLIEKIRAATRDILRYLIKRNPNSDFVSDSTK
jgi:hypothetical protein